MKFFTFRWKMVPLYFPLAHKARKFLHDFGTLWHCNSIFMSPKDVFNVTDIFY